MEDRGQLGTCVLRPASCALRLALLAALAGCDSSSTAPIREVPFDLELDLVVDGLTAPVFLTAPDNDARLFIVERIGRIRIIESGTLLAAPFLDITSRVNFVGERGMLGMAFDPQAENGRFYVQYVGLGGNVVVERFSWTPGRSVAGPSEGVVISIPHGGSENHGGMIAFGPDGMFYLAPGDGGCCGDPPNNAQNMNTLLGKLLRIDVRTPPYSIPPSNPFVGRAGMRGEIWASGLRNPWRFSFDEASNLLYIADVGDDAREEVNVVPATAAGLNYGWRLMEGTACFNPSTNCMSGVSLTLPTHDYPRSVGCAVIGGYVYRGAAIPEVAGHYFYADYCAGWVRSFRVTSAGAVEHRLWAGLSAPGTVSFGRDGAGELYMIGGARVWRIVRN